MLPAGGSIPDKTVLHVQVQNKAYTRAGGGAPIVVLDNIEFALHAGQTLAIIGPSGCGKSTLLRIIAGLDKQYDGVISRPQPGRLSMVFQEPRLLAWRDVETNIRLVAPDISTTALADLLQALGLDEHARAFPGELSLGLARRVAIARAFAVAPQLLLLDEPFVSLDEALVGKLRAELAALVAKHAMTTLLVTHDLLDAVALADQLLVLSARPARILEVIQIDRSNPMLVGDVRRKIADRLAEDAPLVATS